MSQSDSPGASEADGGISKGVLRETTTKWESDFLFDYWDAVVMRLLEKEPRNIGYVVYVLKSELDVLLRNKKAGGSEVGV